MELTTIMMLFGNAPQDRTYTIIIMLNINKFTHPPDVTVLITFYNIKWFLLTSQSSRMIVVKLQQSSVHSVGRSQDLYPEEQALDIIPFV